MPASRTAQYVALYRALETIERGRPRLFEDPFAIRFLSPSLVTIVRAARTARMQAAIAARADYRAPGARTSAIGRTRIIDDEVRRAVAAGTRQLVILGAGYDCRAHRLAELAETTVYEVDRPETQEEKRARLGKGVREDVHYVAVDFLRDDVAERLAAAGWDAGAPTVFLWEGVTNYLTAAAVHEVLAWIGRSAPGSTLVFTYIHGGVLDGSVEFEGGAKMRDNVSELGEPWTFGLHPHEVEPLLARFGMTLRENFGADEYRRRAGLSGDLPGYGFYRLAIACKKGDSPFFHAGGGASSLIPSSRSCSSSTAAGAPVSGSAPDAVLAKAITSRIDSRSPTSATSRSIPKAMPPCGGAPYLSASSRKPKRACASASEMPSTLNTCCCTSGVLIRIEPPPTSTPSTTKS